MGWNVWGRADRFAAWSDEELMARVAQGDRAAFSALSGRHIRRSLAVAQRIVGNPLDAEDVVQEAFVQVWLHAGRWRNDGARFSSWLYRVVVNRALDYRGGTARLRQTSIPLDDDLPVADPAPGSEALVAGQQMEQIVTAAIASLPERQRAAISLCSDQNLRCAQGAEVLGISVSAMESLLVRARRTVRQRLQDAGFLEPDPAGARNTAQARPSAPQAGDSGDSGDSGQSDAGLTDSDAGISRTERPGRQGPKEAGKP